MLARTFVISLALAMMAPAAGAYAVEVGDRLLYVNVYTDPSPSSSLDDAVVIVESRPVGNLTTTAHCVPGDVSDYECQVWSNLTGTLTHSATAWVGCLSLDAGDTSSVCGTSALVDGKRAGAVAGGGSHPGLIFYVCTFPDPSSPANMCRGIYTDQSDGTCAYSWYRDTTGTVQPNEKITCVIT